MLALLKGLGGGLLRGLVPQAVNWGMNKLMTSGLGKTLPPMFLNGVHGLQKAISPLVGENGGGIYKSPTNFND